MTAPQLACASGGIASRWLLLAAVFCPGLPAMAADLGGTVALNSQLVDRGIAITSPTPVVQGSVYWVPATGWSLSLSGAAETRSPGRLLASNAAAARYWTLSDDWQLQAGLARHGYRYTTRDGTWRVERTEASLGWTYRDMMSMSLSVSRTPGSGRLNHAVDFTLRHSLSEHFTLTGGLGIAQVPPFDDGQNHAGHYRYGHAGLMWGRGNWSIELDRVATSANTPRPWGGPRVSPWVATLSLAF